MKSRRQLLVEALICGRKHANAASPWPDRLLQRAVCTQTRKGDRAMSAITPNHGQLLPK